MPTVMRAGPYRLFFYAGDGGEHAHVHVEREDALVKFWLDPACLQRNAGFRPSDPREIERIIEQHQRELMEAWYGYFQG